MIYKSAPFISGRLFYTCPSVIYCIYCIAYSYFFMHMNSRDIRTTFLTFFEKRGHQIVPSAPLVPENDPSVLFNTAGMQPLVPYLMGQPYPTGATRIANVQKCVRTGDIEEQQVVEIWNDVFMEYEKKDGAVIGKLAQKNVDTGAGLERLAMVLQGTDSIFTTDLFDSIVSAVHERASLFDERAERIVSDHIRTAVFLIADGVRPGNTDQGYILRRLLRRAVRYARHGCRRTFRCGGSGGDRI
jgi:alanyl-tRNA synthetase